MSGDINPGFAFDIEDASQAPWELEGSSAQFAAYEDGIGNTVYVKRTWYSLDLLGYRTDWLLISLALKS